MVKNFAIAMVVTVMALTLIVPYLYALVVIGVVALMIAVSIRLIRQPKRRSERDGQHRR